MQKTLHKFAFEDVGKLDLSAEYQLIQQFNQLDEDEPAARSALLKQILALADEVTIQGPLKIFNGQNIRLGRKIYINIDVEISATAPVSIGHHTLIGPHVQIITGTHPVDPTERQQWALWAKPISIGQNVWIGASAIICPGVTIGDHVVIGAGAVVTHDIPACSLAVGNPAKVIRELTPPDEATLYARNP
ncbi:sugar O-acetyltransferase [Chitinibacter bivalviorum]|uniref:Nodulation protein L n=1 Tax=Chitinibacter bivalviorum TaxID=2739434 RepID=A0A7H9BKU8_9NEIS|nr:sugar O-acetyltransferase [Chitinibacter bivalviorum]QLG89305.1 sugar O-acetyltransferase [Chitinibacter bivalviorum]